MNHDCAPSMVSCFGVSHFCYVVVVCDRILSSLLHCFPEGAKNGQTVKKKLFSQILGIA